MKQLNDFVAGAMILNKIFVNKWYKMISIILKKKVSLHRNGVFHKYCMYFWKSLALEFCFGGSVRRLHLRFCVIWQENKSRQWTPQWNLTKPIKSQWGPLCAIDFAHVTVPAECWGFLNKCKPQQSCELSLTYFIMSLAEGIKTNEKVSLFEC